MGILLIKITFFSYFSLIPICGNQDASFGSLDINFVKIVLKALFRYFLFGQSRWYFGILSSNVGIFYHFQNPNTPKLESKRKQERKRQKTKLNGRGRGIYPGLGGRGLRFWVFLLPINISHFCIVFIPNMFYFLRN